MSDHRTIDRTGTEGDARGVVVLERALAVLAAFGPTDLHLSLADLSRRTGINKSTLLRLIETLKRAAYISQGESSLYHVGPASLRLGRLYQAAVSDAEMINSVLRDLVRAHRESASFNVIERDVRVCAYRVSSQHMIRDHVEIGDVLPLGRGSAGKVLLAFSGRDDVPGLEKIRRSFYAVSMGEIEADAASVSVPVFKVEGLAGAMAITGPASRITSERIPELRRALLEVSIALTERFGGDSTGLRRALS